MNKNKLAALIIAGVALALVLYIFSTSFDYLKLKWTEHQTSGGAAPESR